MNARWFSISMHEFDLLNYGLIGLPLAAGSKKPA